MCTLVPIPRLSTPICRSDLAWLVSRHHRASCALRSIRAYCPLERSSRGPSSSLHDCTPHCSASSQHHRRSWVDSFRFVFCCVHTDIGYFPDLPIKLFQWVEISWPIITHPQPTQLTRCFPFPCPPLSGTIRTTFPNSLGALGDRERGFVYISERSREAWEIAISLANGQTDLASISSHNAGPPFPPRKAKHSSKWKWTRLERSRAP